MRINKMPNYYDSIRENPNNLSFWYPKIKNCGIKVPETIIIPIPETICKSCMMDKPVEDTERILEFIKSEVMPKIPPTMFFLFMKNGTFSNKFNFADCRVTRNFLQITRHFIELNYTSFMFGTGGNAELVIREWIGDNNLLDHTVPCIYNGMPLRPEFRVFYDFDKKKPLYVVNYWDWDYCYEEISRNYTDKIVYSEYYPILNEFFNEHKDEVFNLVSEHMKEVSLSGKWSVDVMWDTTTNEYILIDMALAEESAYWNPDNN